MLAKELIVPEHLKPALPNGRFPAGVTPAPVVHWHGCVW